VHAFKPLLGDCKNSLGSITVHFDPLVSLKIVIFESKFNIMDAVEMLKASIV